MRARSSSLFTCAFVCASVAAAFSGCNAISGLSSYVVDQAGGAAASTTSASTASSTSSSGQGGQGGAAGGPCETADDCPGVDDECKTKKCTSGVCTIDFAPKGTLSKTQNAGDCKSAMCDGAGAIVQVDDDADVPVDGNDCTDDVCAKGAPSNPPLAVESPCAKGVCDGQGGCVECVIPSDCAGSDAFCSSRTCTADMCGTFEPPAGTPLPMTMQTPGDCQLLVCDGSGNQVSQPDDTDVPENALECVITSCSMGKVTMTVEGQGVKCLQGVCDGQGNCVECNFNSDCSGALCINHVCQAATCSDMIKDGGESDIDCGGPECAPCGTGAACVQASDCQSDVCKALLCQAATCKDMVKNGAETDVDCGGGACPKCATSEKCDVASDCVSGVCTGGVCQAPTCNDMVKNGSETDVDCGGPTCPKCPSSAKCASASDCQSAVCTGGVCQAPTCSDGVMNGTESDVDCGGGACLPCGDGSTCVVASDCTSGVCTGGKCQAPTCTDGVKNGNETDVDCGGGACSSCASGKACAKNLDCGSEYCSSGACAAIVDVELGNNYACALLGDGTVACWGDNASYQLGDGTNVKKLQPHVIPGLTSVASLSLCHARSDVANAHSCALLTNGSVECWGENNDGQVGDGTQLNKTTPTPVSTLGAGTTKAISLGGLHSCAIETNGSVVCWGRGSLGQLGNGLTTGAQPTPVATTTVSGAVAIALEDSSSTALDATGKVWAWGYNRWYELGNGAITNALTPISPAVTSVESLVAGGDFAFAMQSATSVYAWGTNWRGELGDNSATDLKTPALVAQLTNVAQISAAGSPDQKSTCTGCPPTCSNSEFAGHACAVLTSGAVECWGQNADGELGLGTTSTDVLVPTTVPGLANVAQVATGARFSCARLTSGALRCWGLNSYGQLGINTTTSPVKSPTPVIWP